MLPESVQLRLQRLYPGSLVKNATQVVLIARPKKDIWRGSTRSEDGDLSESTFMGDTSLLTWVMQALTSLLEKPQPKVSSQ